MYHPTVQPAKGNTLTQATVSPLTTKLEGGSLTQVTLSHQAKVYTRVEVGGGTLYHRVECPPLPQVNSECVQRYENCFQYPLEGHSKTSNNQALLNPFYHKIKMKAYMRTEGGGGETLYPGIAPHSPLPQTNIHDVHWDEI